jgi:hypothetical protein
MNTKALMIVLAGLFWLAGSVNLQHSAILAQEQVPTRPPQRPKPSSLQDAESLSPEQRSELRKFVRENLPELEKLMSVLYERKPDQFQRLLSSVNQSYQRLQAIKKSGDESQYANALENWKLDARIKMIATQLSFRDLPVARKRLTRLIGKQIDSRLKMMREEKARLEQRLTDLESNLSKLESERESEVDRRLNSILRGSEKIRAERKLFQAQPGSQSEADSSSKESSGDSAIRKGRGREPNRKGAKKQPDASSPSNPSSNKD